MKTRYTISIFLVVIFAGSGFGQCWEEVTIEGYEDRWYRDIQFADSLHGWITFEAFRDSSGGVLRTMDGGKTWKEPDSLPDSTIPILTVINKDTVYIHFRPGREFYYTYDGGNSFKYYELDDFSYLYADFIDSKRVWTMGRGTLGHYTKDGGKNWDTFNIVDSIAGNFFGIEVGNKNAIWVYGLNSGVFVTKNGGQNWTEITNHPDFKDVNLIEGDCLDSLHCFFVGTNQYIYQTKDGGKSWTDYELTDLVGAQDIKYIDSLTAWFVSIGDSSVYQTIDGGNTWRRNAKFNVEKPSLSDISFINNNEGWVAGGARISADSQKGYLYHYKNFPPECINEINATLTNDSLLVLEPVLRWQSIEGCVDGYQIKIGTIENGDDLISLTDVGLDTFFSGFAILPADTSVFVTVIPYNSTGTASNCKSFSYKTESKPVSTDDFLNFHLFRIYPNPTLDHFWMDMNMNERENVKINLFSPEGKLMASTDYGLLPSGRQKLKFETPKLSGIFFIQILAGSEIAYRRVSIF